ncbi:S41 family peptidase [Sphingobacterium kyonggiense]|uniref:S41 family peptidase n=1 Tax=Sphingobacterium kyonggiense TaxID=714075 RepID=A0ABP7Z1F0_9SPHI
MQKGRKRNIFVAATYAATLLLGLILGQNYSDQTGFNTGGSLVPIGLSDNAYKIQQVVDLISTRYVDSINMDSVQNGAINHIISHLDPYSAFLMPNASKTQSEVLEGTFEGIGMEYFNLNDTLIVVGLITNGPADKGGFKIGDKILQIGNRKISGNTISKDEVEKLMRGKRGTAVEMYVERDSMKLSLPLKAIRDQISVSSLDVAYMLKPTVGFIRIRRFGLKTADEFKDAVVELKKQGAKNLILDLRDNGGGYFHVAIKLASEFFTDQRLVVFTEGAHEARQDFLSEPNGNYAQGKLILLVNERTASASEVVAGAVQDWDRGVVIGRRTYGKATVQELFNFADGSTINLSIARYYTPLGRSIQRKYSPNWSNMKDYASMYHGLWSLDTTYAHAKPYQTGLGKKVYSGGGIMPDVKVPIDSNEVSVLYRDLVQSSLIEQFVYSRFARKLPAYSIENFLQGYTLPATEYASFIRFLARRGLQLSPSKQNDLHDLIQSDIEALLGRYYFGREAYFKVKNRYDTFVTKALEELQIKAE